MRRSVGFGALALTAALVAGAGAVASPAAALPADRVGAFPTWSVAGSSGASTAQPTFPASSGFPATTVASTSTTLGAPSGVTAFLGAGTGFGTEYGTTRSQPYLTISPAPGGAPSVTTIDFATAPAAGWGFALGDIDADWAYIEAFDGATPVAIADLGFRAVGNYCTATPRPGTCAATPYTDQPVWVTAPETFDGIAYTPGTLRGNSLPGSPAPTRDTSGAYGWFQPTVPVTRLQITYGVRDGSPTAQLWLAASAPLVRLAGTVSGPTGPAPAGTVVQLESSSGAPLLDIQDQPLAVPVDPATGAWTADVEQRADGFLAQVVPPAGFVVPPPFAVPGVPDAPGSPAATAPSVVVAAVSTPAAPAAGPALAASGMTDVGVPTAIAAGLVASGMLLLGAGPARRRRRTGG